MVGRSTFSKFYDHFNHGLWVLRLLMHFTPSLGPSHLISLRTTTSKCMHDAWGSRSDLRFVCRSVRTCPPHHASYMNMMHAQLPPPLLLLILPPYRWIEWIQPRSSQVPKSWWMDRYYCQLTCAPWPWQCMPFQHRKGGFCPSSPHHITIALHCIVLLVPSVLLIDGSQDRGEVVEQGR
jgi:hypothetical protein